MLLDALFSPGNIGTLELRNRIVLPAMGTAYPDKDGFVTERLIDYHVARVKGGCALNTVENAAVHENSKAPNTLGIYDDRFIPGFTRLTDRIRKEGGKSCLQIWHAGRQTRSALTGQQIVAPSPIPCPLNKEMPKELSLAEIDEGNVKIDICVNKNCGAIHLDPGELKSIIKDQGALSSAKKAFLSVFKT